GRAPADRGREGAGGRGAAGYDTVGPRRALFALADHASAARGLVHADGLGRRAACTAGRARLVLALGRRLGARGLRSRDAVRGRAHRRGDEAGLSCRSGPPPASAVGACTGARARAFTRSVGRARGDSPCNHERAFRSVAQPMPADLGARATRLLVARRRSVSAITAATLHIRPRAAMSAAAAVQGETVGLIVVAVLALVGTWMRLVLLPAG